MTSAADITAALRVDSSLDEMRALLVRARKQLLNREARDREVIEAVYLAAKDAAFSYPRDRKAQLPPKGHGKKAGREEVALLHLTDWQYGKRTSDFNMAICSDRINEAVDKTIHLTDLHRASRPIDTCHVMLGGDMIEGMTIFPGQMFEIEAGLYDQVFGAAHLISSTIDRLLGAFRNVVVWDEYGNHGRIGRFGELPSEENLDRVCYRIARNHFVDMERLTWHAGTSWHQIVKIGNYHALLIHGDEIRSFGGNHPSYGIIKRVQAWQSGVVEPFQDCYIGHFHRPDSYTLAAAGTIFITGSPESSNEYAAVQMAATGRPSQRLHFVDPEAGRVTAEYRLWLT